jgi:hypothetical protein
MNKYEVTPYVLSGIENGNYVLDIEQMKVIEAETSFEAARKYKVKRVQFWHIRKIK